MDSPQIISKNLDEQGGLTRTQLYFVTAILSLCVIGLSGYLILDTHNTVLSPRDQTSSNTDDSNTEDNDSGNTEVNVELTTNTFHCASYVNSTPVPDQWSFTIEYPEAITVNQISEDCGEIRFNYNDSFLRVILTSGSETNQLSNDLLTVNESLQVVRNASLENTITEFNNRAEYVPQYYYKLSDTLCIAGPINPELHSPCGNDDLFANNVSVFITAHIPTSITIEQANEVLEVFDTMVGSITLNQ